jgi:hypothetical protein
MEVIAMRRYNRIFRSECLGHARPDGLLSKSDVELAVDCLAPQCVQTGFIEAPHRDHPAMPFQRCDPVRHA